MTENVQWTPLETEPGPQEEEGESQVVTADLSKADLVPEEGVYTLEVVSASQRRSRAGNPMIVIGFEVIKDPHGGEYVGCFIYDNLMLRGTRAKLAAAAVRGLLGHVPAPGTWSTGDLLGRQVEAELFQDESDDYGVTARVAQYL